MAKRIDPIRHWSIGVFVVIAVGVGAAALPTLARYGGWSPEPKTPRDLKYTGLALAVLIMLQFAIWKEILDFFQDRREKKAKEWKNPYDQTPR